MSFYTSPSAEFITSRLDPRLLNKLYNPLYNISAILGDTDGKLNLSTTNAIIKDLAVTENGMVYTNIISGEPPTETRGTKFLRHHSQGLPIMSADISLNSQGRFMDFDPTMTLGEAEAPVRLTIEIEKKYADGGGTEFDNRLTSQGLKAYMALSELDTSLVDDTEFGEISSPILPRASKVLLEHEDATLNIKVVLIELLALFVTVSAVDKDYGINAYDLNDLALIGNNVSSILYHLETVDAVGWETYELIEILRDAFKAVKSIAINKELFKETYATRYNSIYLGGDLR